MWITTALQVLTYYGYLSDEFAVSEETKPLFFGLLFNYK